jgi:hypothetical protein
MHRRGRRLLRIIAIMCTHDWGGGLAVTAAMRQCGNASAATAALRHRVVVFVSVLVSGFSHSNSRLFVWSEEQKVPFSVILTFRCVWINHQATIHAYHLSFETIIRGNTMRSKINRSQKGVIVIGHLFYGSTSRKGTYKVMRRQKCSPSAIDTASSC